MKVLRSLALALVTLATGSVLALAQDVCGPGKITNLLITTGKTTAVAEWTNVGDDCATGNATSVQIRRATSTITEATWCNATIVFSGSAGSQGTNSCVDLDAAGAHSCGTTYYWAIKSIDDADNYSPLSNVDQEATKGCGTSEEVHCTRLQFRPDGNVETIPVSVRGINMTPSMG